MLLSDNQTQKNRMDICKGCPSVQNISIFGMTCGTFGVQTKTTCGCVVAMKVKFNSSKCPQKKW